MVKIIAIGELLIDLIGNNLGVRLEEQTAFKRFAGGAPANFAVGIRRLGLTSGVITKVGNDFFGRFLLKTLKNEKVDVSQIKITSEHKTALAFVGLDENRSPSFSFYRSPCADIMLTPEEISEEYIKSAKLLMYGTVSMADEPARSAIFKAIEYAKKHGLQVACDPNLREDLWHYKDPREHIFKALKDTDIFLPSISEAEFITGERGERALEAILELGPSIIGVTHGAEGSTIMSKGGIYSAPAYKVDVVDTTGAGDAYAAGLVTGLLNKMPLNKIPYFANAVSALKITKEGAMNIPTRQEVEV
ncbi:MAG: carbohydrate kinase, partial [Candidatus Heimdallarchaeota archaeon]|nr:carbohydrate kinase [Candidatus Heimdallarchaeota archaeon]